MAAYVHFLNEETLVGNGSDVFDDTDDSIMALVGKDDCKSVAKQPEYRTRWNGCFKFSCKTLQEYIPMGIAVPIVDQAEVLDVEHEDGCFLCCTYYMLQVLQVCSVIGNPCQ